jgi:hypothetical protein
MYPPRPPERSRKRPAAVPSRTGATTSSTPVPRGKSAFSSPKRPTPGSRKQAATPSTAAMPSSAGRSAGATRQICRSLR